MAWRVGRFVRGVIDEDVQGGGVDVDAVFDHDRIAAALAALQRAASDAEKGMIHDGVRMAERPRT